MIRNLLIGSCLLHGTAMRPSDTQGPAFVPPKRRESSRDNHFTRRLEAYEASREAMIPRLDAYDHLPVEKIEQSFWDLITKNTQKWMWWPVEGDEAEVIATRVPEGWSLDLTGVTVQLPPEFGDNPPERSVETIERMYSRYGNRGSTRLSEDGLKKRWGVRIVQEDSSKDVAILGKNLVLLESNDEVRVQLTGLKTERFNGREGVVLGPSSSRSTENWQARFFDSKNEEERWQVKFSNQEDGKSIKRQNLIPLQPSLSESLYNLHSSEPNVYHVPYCVKKSCLLQSNP